MKTTFFLVVLKQLKFYEKTDRVSFGTLQDFSIQHLIKREDPFINGKKYTLHIVMVLLLQILTGAVSFNFCKSLSDNLSQCEQGCGVS